MRKQIFGDQMSCIFTKRSIGDNSMGKDNNVSDVIIIALKNIFEVGKFECGVDI